MNRRPVVFLSDYGLDDEFVGVVHRVIHRVIQPAGAGPTVIDLTHRIRPHDVRAGALTLWRAAPWLHDTVVLAVVDPGVGTDRRPVAIEVGAAGTVLVGPDNGLLLPAAHALGSVTSAVKLRRPAAGGGRGRTFDGRDVFAPAAARIASGEWAVADAGDPVDPASLIAPALATTPRAAAGAGAGGGLRCEVLWVDRFGNAQLNARPADLAGLGDRVKVRAGGSEGIARQVGAFGELQPGELGLVADSYGLLALAFDRAAAAAELGLAAGDQVGLGPA